MLTAIDNVALLETATKGDLVLTPSAMAEAYFYAKRKSVFENPAARSAFLENAFIPWREAFAVPREWDSYLDKMTTRRMEFAATSILLDAHGVPGSVQNNPNDPQNELRLNRWRPDYRQAALYQNRDEFTPITVDTLEIARIFQGTGPKSTEVSEYVNSQIIMGVNADRARELHTMMKSIGEFARQANIYHVQIPDLRPESNPTEAEAREAAATIRALVKSLANFTTAYSPAHNPQNVPASQVRLNVRVSWIERLGTIAYATSFNPEYVFALPADQVVELPDEYFDRNPGLEDQVAFLTDAGTDSRYGSLVVVDTFHEWGVDPYPIKSSENRALHHASILDVNPFKTFVTFGIGAGDPIIVSNIIPATVTGTVYGPAGDIAGSGGSLVRGQQYSTSGAVVDAAGLPAGGYTVSITSTQNSATDRTEVGLYNTLMIGADDLATSITVKWTSVKDPTKSVSHTYTITGTAFAYDGSGIIASGESVVFAPGSGSGGTITYTLATGTTGEISPNGTSGWTALGASPVAVPTGQTRYVRTRAAAGYVFPDGLDEHSFGPWTAA